MSKRNWIFLLYAILVYWELRCTQQWHRVVFSCCVSFSQSREWPISWLVIFTLVIWPRQTSEHLKSSQRILLHTQEHFCLCELFSFLSRRNSRSTHIHARITLSLTQSACKLRSLISPVATYASEWYFESGSEGALLKTSVPEFQSSALLSQNSRDIFFSSM